MKTDFRFWAVNANLLTSLAATASFLTLAVLVGWRISLPTLQDMMPSGSGKPAVLAASATASPASGTDLVASAQAFKALLTTTQQNTLQKTYKTTLARKWSNLPCGSTCRNGIQFSTLSDAQPRPCR